ncbi:hypothetical protein BDW59DRAFT_118177 [Aspergillus cavernicola]|uniref:Myb-like domain-containing protein n=1 Tax=Aspergillus cavernicola TaxID=176166 RepID=A0ABR4HZS0_9EURO
MCDYSLRSSHPMSSESQSPSRWTDGERERLYNLRKLHSHLSWPQFHQLNFFPQRTKVAMYHEFLRMEKTHTRKRLQSSKDRASYNTLSPAKRPLAPALGNVEGRLSKQLRMRDDNDDDESNDDDGDIENDGETKRLQNYPLRSPEQQSTPVLPLSTERRETSVPTTPQSEKPSKLVTLTLFERPSKHKSEPIHTAKSPERPVNELRECPGRSSSLGSVRSTTQFPVTQTGPSCQNMGAPATNTKPSHPAPISPTASRESTRTPVAETPTPTNVPPLPTPPTTSTQHQHSKAMTPATGTETPVPPIETITTSQCLDTLTQRFKQYEQDNQTRTESEARLKKENEQLIQQLRQQFQKIGSVRTKSKTENDQLLEQLATQSKENEHILSSKNEEIATQNKEIAALTKQLEEMKDKAQKFLKLQEYIQSTLNS